MDHLNEVVNENFKMVKQKAKEEKMRIMVKNSFDDITSYYPSYLFNCLQTLLSVLADNLKGLAYLKVVETILHQLNEIQKQQISDIKNLKSSSDLLLCCVFINDGDNCLINFKGLKRQIKNQIIPDLLERVKEKLTLAKKIFVTTIQEGVKKAISLLFLEAVEMRDLFTFCFNKAKME